MLVRENRDLYFSALIRHNQGQWCENERMLTSEQLKIPDSLRLLMAIIVKNI